mgnify:CR=1 FL=1
MSDPLGGIRGDEIKVTNPFGTDKNKAIQDLNLSVDYLEGRKRKRDKSILQQMRDGSWGKEEKIPNWEPSPDSEFDGYDVILRWAGKEITRVRDVNKKEAKVIPFWPTFISKDLAVLGIFLLFYFYLVFFHYNFAMDPVNFDPADNMVTPAHIYPEWYFLWSYEILRPFSKDLGLIAFGIAQVIFFALPFMDRSPNTVAANRRGAPFMIWFWLMLANMIVLTAMGKLPPEGIYSTIGYWSAILFVAQWLILPIMTSFEKKV